MTGTNSPPNSTNRPTVDWASTVNPGDNATASVSFDDAKVNFSFGISHDEGGPTAYQCQPGEVANTNPTTPINDTSSHTNPVSISTAAQLQLLFDKMDELIAALRR